VAERRQREVEAREHQADVAKRNQEKAASGKKRAPALPVPSAASGASAP
jgi:hypothetical protein